MKTLERRFFEKVAISGIDPCWYWTASVDRNGYGQLRVSGSLVYATHISLELFGRPLPKKMCALHTCDNPSCVNPSHLFHGTRSDNMKDKIAKGRQLRGVQCRAAKLLPVDVSEIRNSRKTNQELSVEHGVSPSAISLARNKKTWRHIDV